MPRRRETICLRRAEPPVAAVRLSTNFHLIHNSLRQMLYGVIRIAEPAREHVDNNFTPIEAQMAAEYTNLRNHVTSIMGSISENLRNGRSTDNDTLVAELSKAEAETVAFSQKIGVAIQGENINLNSMTLILHIAQETQQLVVELRELVKTSKAYREQLLG